VPSGKSTGGRTGRRCRSEQEVADQVRRTVIHEVAHHFGIDDDRLRELGW
jgi:predicted Zn-dependent protease with MMP-like domain